MGSLHAQEFADAAGRGEVSLDASLGWHLQYNHYPPINLVFLPVVKEAIAIAAAAVAFGDDERWQETLEMPNGITKTVAEIVEEVHLHAFVEQFIDPSEEE